MKSRRWWMIVGAATLAATSLAAQARPGSGAPDSAELIPGARFRAGWLTRWLLGANYRDLWAQPIKAERLDLAQFPGGATLECRGGWQQAASLTLQGADQRTYLFHAADRGPAGSLLRPQPGRPPMASLLRDQVASRHPAAGVVVTPLLEAADVLHPESRLAILPPGAELAELGQVFGGTLGTVDEQPGDGFAGSERVAGTQHVWEQIDASSADRVDARTYLAGRLIDILVGDWDRRFDRWHWAAYPSDWGRVWRPIPRDREQAFSRLEGLAPSVARRYLPQLVSFGPSYPDLYGLTWSARSLDRRFLVELDRAAWDSVARRVQGHLTNRVLETAVERLPAELRQLDGEELLSAVTRRRDLLLDASDAFYALVAEYADVHATSQDDWVEVERAAGGQVRVRLAPATAPSVAYFDRTFVAGESREVRLYLGGGDDRVVVRGSSGRSVVVRVVGGPGDDRLIDSSRVGLPVLRSLLTSTFFYDSDGNDVFVAGPGTEIDRRPFRAPASREAEPPTPGSACAETAAITPPPRELTDPFRDWGSRWIPAPWLSFQPNLGLLVGAGATHYGYAFRKAPFGSRSTLRAAYATGPGRLRVWYEGDFRNLPHRAWGSLNFRYSGIDFLRFYGFGNETVISAPEQFYQISQRQVAAVAWLTAFPPNSRISVGPFFAFAETELGRGTLVDTLRPYGSEDFVEIGASARVEVDTRDRALAPRRGLHLIASGRLVPKAFDATRAYGWVSGEASTYFSVGNPARLTLAVRAGGKRVWGRYPFHAAAYVGGAATLRGYNEQRFAGDAVAYGNGEVRVSLARVSVLVPGELGVLALGDVGRAYLAGEPSQRWHGAVGGGVWLALIERGSTVTLTAARSPERWAYYGGLGFMF